MYIILSPCFYWGHVRNHPFLSLNYFGVGDMHFGIAILNAAIDFMMTLISQHHFTVCVKERKVL